ncbi:MAG: response regulator [Marinilabiliaceae bacterium]|nr:response regulator [Marinilabiliaceae bacterium]
MKHIFKFIFSATIVALCPFAIIAQNILKFEYYGSEQGLSQNSVYSMACDQNGFIWVGTLNGIDRFDGERFRFFNNQSSSNNNRVVNLWVDKANYVWVKTYDGCFQYFDQRHEEFGILPEQKGIVAEPATSFSQYSDSIVIVGSTHSGAYILRLNEDNRYEYKNLTFNNREVKNLFVDSNKNLWILLSNGLVRLSEKEIIEDNIEINISHEKYSFTGAICQYGTTILIGTENEPVSFTLFGRSIDSKNIIPSISENLHHITYLQTIPDNTAAFIATFDGHAYLHSAINNNLTEIKFHGYGKQKVDKVYTDQYHQLWITTEKPGVTRFNIANSESKYYQLTPEYLAPTIDLERPVFFEDGNKNLWIGTHGGGLVRYNRMEDKFEEFRNNANDDYSIPSNIVHCIAQDPSGQLWVGTGQYRGGLVKIITENKAFRNIIPNNNQNSQVDNVVRAIMEDPAGNLWVATKSGHIYIYDANGNMIRTLDGLNSDNGEIHSLTYDMMVDSKGLLWIATKGEGVLVSKQKPDYANISKSPLYFSQFSSVNTNGELASMNAYKLTEDKSGNIWIGTFGGGISRMTHTPEGRFHTNSFNSNNSNILSDKVRNLLVDHNGDLWVATVNGACRIKKDDLNAVSINFEHFVHSADNNTMSYNDICQVYEDSEESIYFATIGGGLDIMTFDKNGNAIYENFNTKDGLCNNAVYSIAQTSKDAIWLATENGLCKMNLKTRSFEAYNDKSGLSFNSFSEATGCTIKNGRMVFGGFRGFIIVSPTQISTTPYESNLVLTRMLIGGYEYPIGEDEPLNENIAYASSVHLSPSQTSFTIDFHTLDYLDQHNVLYKYILEGVDDEWNNVGGQTYARYTNIKPGTYTFRVKHTFRNGNWSDNSRDLIVKIDAPWWKTWWAYTIYAIIFGIIAYSIYRTIRRFSHFRHELKLEKKLNDVKLQFFTNIAHEIRTPLTLIVAPIESLNKREDLPIDVHNNLMIVRRNSNRLLLLINQLLDFRKIQNKKMNLEVSQCNIGQLVKDVYDSFKLLADHKHINYRIEIQEGMQSVWIDAKEIDTVVYNLLSNAMKFTEDGKNINVRVTQDNSASYILISDEGCGMTEAEQSQLFKRYTILSSNALSGTGIGLSLAYELVKLHGGDIIVQSRKGIGSTFTVRIPVGRNHLENNPDISFVQSTHKSNNQQNSILGEIFDDKDESETYNGSVSCDVHNVPADAKRILIVEDNTEIQNYLFQSLSNSYICVGASNGNEALILVKEQIPDIIITDLMMPVMDGTTMIKTLKKEMETSHIPIIALTAKSSIEDEIETLKLGIDAFISKPFNMEHLRTIIDNIFVRKSQLVTQITGVPISIESSSSSANIKNPGNYQDISLHIPSKDEEFLKELVHFTEENFKQDLAIDDFASHFNMSRTVFYNKVKGLTNQSPLEFVRQIKFKIAAELLKKGYNVSEVAFEIGYSDVKYFSRQFKAQFGYTPSQVKES